MGPAGMLAAALKSQPAALRHGEGVKRECAITGCSRTRSAVKV
jgi:hypothetical protein